MSEINKITEKNSINIENCFQFKHFYSPNTIINLYTFNQKSKLQMLPIFLKAS